MRKLNERTALIRTREDFVNFVRALRFNLDTDPDSWENADLGRFLDAMAAWVEDMDGYYKNRCEPLPQQPDWTMFGLILTAARGYE